MAACKKQTHPLNENYIPVNKCQSYTISGNTVTVCLDSVIQDSRCPADAVCIWQGIAAARFAVNTANTDHLIRLATTKLAGYNRDTTIAGFKIEFIALLPQNKLASPVDYNEYIAEVKITKP
ncbi:MAG: hypothetical protein H7Z13_15470 [Ferruginibacter sp.]|nr:hypothetical protein [Ferruginibacter sp.]